MISGGVSLGLLVSGLSATFVGKMFEAHGGRPVLAVGMVLLSCGLALLGLSRNLPAYYLAWAVMGAGMACGLYDAAFSTLGRIFGRDARSASPLGQVREHRLLAPLGLASRERGLAFRLLCLRRVPYGRHHAAGACHATASSQAPGQRTDAGEAARGTCSRDRPAVRLPRNGRQSGSAPSSGPRRSEPGFWR